MKYEDIEIGDIVCAKTELGDIDIDTLGQVTNKLDKSTYEPMRVINVSHYNVNLQNVANYGVFAPKDLVKIDIKLLYQIMKCQKAYPHFENLQVRRRKI